MVFGIFVCAKMGLEARKHESTAVSRPNMGLGIQEISTHATISVIKKRPRQARRYLALLQLTKTNGHHRMLDLLLP